MTYTYDLTTNVGKIRRSLPDRSMEENPIQDDDYIWSDEELASFLEDYGDWRRASAHILETMAADSAYVLQVIKIQNITTDGSKVAQVLMARAQKLKDDADTVDNADDGGFDIAEVVWDDFTYRTKRWNEAIRNA